jgi:hypothetical protein
MIDSVRSMIDPLRSMIGRAIERQDSLRKKNDRAMVEIAFSSALPFVGNILRAAGAW